MLTWPGGSDYVRSQIPHQPISNVDVDGRDLTLFHENVLNRSFKKTVIKNTQSQLDDKLTV